MKRQVATGLGLALVAALAVALLPMRPDRGVASVGDAGAVAVPGSDAPAAAAGRPAPRALKGGSTLDPDAWFLAQSDQVKASILMGLGPDYGGKGSLAAHFLALEQRIAAGDESAVLPAANLFRDCELLASSSEGLAGQQGPSRLIAAACQTLPFRDPGYDRALVAEAAQRGVEQAVLSEWGFPPRSVVYSRDREVRRAWASGVADRLERLAARGNVEARLALGRAYLADDYGIRDYGMAAKHYRSFLDSAPRSDPRRAGTEAFLARICAAGQVDDSRACG